jgi:hypothetical protein
MNGDKRSTQIDKLAVELVEITGSMQSLLAYVLRGKKQFGNGPIEEHIRTSRICADWRWEELVKLLAESTAAEAHKTAVEA